MSAETAGGTDAMRQIRTLFTLGSTGAMNDSRLLGIFLEGQQPDAEDAFAAIVRRHGPMVLGACRRMLDNPADADDAFQATFLILARQASAIIRKESLASWLHGVAVRASREIRRRDARRRMREEQAMQEIRVESVPVDDHADLIPLLDGELARLPERYRIAILACEIEGKSRRDAAQQLGITEGTLSSRLARGRKMLRDRLAARGVSLGTMPIAGPWRGLITPHLPESLAISTTRAAAGSISGGAASAAVLTVVDRILKTMLLAKLKAGLVAAVAIGIGSILTVTLAAGPNTADPQVTAEPPKPAAKIPAKTKAEVPHDPRYARARGVVVDEAGKPVPGVKVTLIHYVESRPGAITDAQGRFDFNSGLASLDSFQLLVATTADGARQGIHHYSLGSESSEAEADVRIVLKPSRKVTVRVTDRDKQPVAGATAEVYAGSWSYYVIDEVKTDRSGQAAIQVPADAKIRWITAFKSKLGFDHMMIWRHADDQPLREIPNPVELVLDGARTITVKAVDTHGSPIAGVPIYPWFLLKDGRGRPEDNDEAGLSGSLAARVKTDAQGIASFDWIPDVKHHLQFFAADPRYDSPACFLRGQLKVKTIQTTVIRAFEDLRDGVSAWANGTTLTMHLRRSESIRGRVTRPDGRPASGVLLSADGLAFGGGLGRHGSRMKTRTANDGTYEMTVCSDHVYAVAVTDEDWAAPTRFGVIVREGKPTEGIDFWLRRGTLVHGMVTRDPDRAPIAGDFLNFVETVTMPPGVPNPVATDLEGRRFATTDDHGRYAIRLGPGTFAISGSPVPLVGSYTITVTDEDVLEHDIHVP